MRRIAPAAVAQRRDPAAADPRSKYNVARKTDLGSKKNPDGIYIRCSGWGSIHNIELLEKNLDVIWSSMRCGKVAGAIHGFGKLLASL